MKDITLNFYNTATRQKERFTPLQERHVRLYTCGPTVYNFAHIGNYRTYIFEDLLRRTLKFFGMQVTQVMNLTDVDDKTIRGAREKGVSLDTYTAPFKKAFFEDLKILSIESVEHYPAATNYIKEMIQLIQKLLEKQVAYKGADGSIYFSIAKFSPYGELSHLNLDELKAGASERMDSDEYEKDHVSDFVVWKAYDKERDGKIFWESPFGPGRPGWHMECSAMALELLGDKIDIHCGGVDNIFPHHENEIAQSEACTGTQFVRFWMHSEHLLVDHKKMAKRYHNFYTLRDLIDKGYTGNQVRYLLLQTHYRTQLHFSFEGLEAAKHAIERLNEFVQRMQRWESNSSAQSVEPLLEKTLQKFAEALADDLNISVALAALFDCIREVNARADRQDLSKEGALQIIQFMEKVDSILGVIDFAPSLDVPKEVEEALQRREEARKSKDWAQADHFRDLIIQQGFVIKDTPKGPLLSKKS